MSDYGSEIEWTASLVEELDQAERAVNSTETFATGSTPSLDTSVAIALESGSWIGSQDIVDEDALRAELAEDALSDVVDIYKDPRSLIERFRPRGSLSVTDFCSPSVRSSRASSVSCSRSATVLRDQVLLFAFGQTRSQPFTKAYPY